VIDGVDAGAQHGADVVVGAHPAAGMSFFCKTRIAGVSSSRFVVL
jgi:hypothetical protein